MKSIWYHGSPVQGITSFVVDKPRYDSLEGPGIYLTQSYKIAREYAGSEGSVYEVEVAGALLDLTTFEEFEVISHFVSKLAGVNLLTLEYTKETFDRVLSGDFQISPHKGMGLGWQIKNILDNNESFVTKEGSDEITQEVERKVNEYLLSYDIWLYQDSKLGLIMLIKNPDKVKPTKEIVIGSNEESEYL